MGFSSFSFSPNFTPFCVSDGNRDENHHSLNAIFWITIYKKFLEDYLSHHER